jgi:transketolase
MTPTASLDELAELARVARVDAIKALWAAQSGHPGSSLSTMDVVVTLYFGGYLRHDPTDPSWEDRDIFILSQGHAAPGYYACLALAGYFPRRELDTLRSLGSPLEGHVKRGTVPGVECSTGSLGQGLNFGTGAALGARLRERQQRVVVMTSDGDQQEGSHWEGVMFAGSRRLPNLLAIVDANGNQINGPTHLIHPVMDDLMSKYKSFEWEAVEIDGHDYEEIVRALDAGFAADGPFVVISRTTTGKGVPFMEGDYHWHHGVITDDLFREAMAALGEPVSPEPDETWKPGYTEPRIDSRLLPLAEREA